MNAQTQITAAPQASSVGFLNVESFEFSQRVANMLSNSTLVPEQYRAITKVKVGKDNYGNMQFRDEPNPNGLSNCIVALNMANRMGADPLMIMQNLYLIEGRPSWSSQFIMASINSCGRFSSLRFEVENLGEVEVEYQETAWSNGRKNVVAKTLKVENSTCVAWAIESGTEIPNFSLEELKEHGGVYKCCKAYGIPLVESSKISVEMAVKEGWYMKNGSKWKTMPEQMLRYRAASFFGRVYAPELLMGLRSVEEEKDRIIDVTPDQSLLEQADANQLKREILGVKSPAALDEMESKVLMLSDDAKREELLKMISAQVKKFQPAAEASAKKPEPQHEEAPPVKEVKEVQAKKPTSAELKKSFAKALNNAKSEREVAAIESQIESSFDLSEADKKYLAVNVQQMYDKYAPAENAPVDPAPEQLSVNELQRLQKEAEKLVAQKEESPAADPIKSQMAKDGLKNQIANAPNVEALKEIAQTVREYKLKLTNDDMGEILQDYAARKKLLEDQQDMFADVVEEPWIDGAIKRIAAAKNQDDINAEYSDPMCEELSDKDRQRLDLAAQKREAELFG
ncbi:hypothetical protein [Acinetobacter sp. ANC 5378]|uniref:hypothetical protein n=1 Tax=Acinetobacter sp. ANC 5378 TaxID=2731249 RepID=UPI00148FC048|nr:hypothetical protein [Acinetobacter sp. ANC 5378]NNG82017.1 hypothetical protein [Acinetobacter sp. ANC 5378]